MSNLRHTDDIAREIIHPTKPNRDWPGAPGRLIEWLQSKGNAGVPLLALLNGALLSRAFAPVDAFPVIFISIPLMLLMVWHAPTAKQAFKWGWWTGLGFFTTSLGWIGHSFQMQGPNPVIPVAVAPFAVLALSAAMSLYTGFSFALTKYRTKPGLTGIVVFAASWTLFELARGYLFTGFPWHLIGTIWANHLPAAQMVYYVTTYGLSFLTILAAAAPITLFIKQKPAPIYGITGPLVSIAMIALFFTVGFIRLNDNPTRYHPEMTLRLVQPNIDQRELWIPELYGEHLNKELKLSRNGSKMGKADGVKLLIWPESSVMVPTVDRSDSIERWRIAQTLELGSYALVGAPRFDKEIGKPVQYFNSMMAIGARRDIFARYDKSHLVPFGEYMPFADFFEQIGISHLTGGSAFHAGEKKQTIALPGIPSFSPLICYEAIFPGAAFAEGNRPEWLLNITNDGWFGLTEGPHQHLALTRIRAIEEGLPLVRSAITGVSAVFDPFGREIDILPAGRASTIDSILPQSTEPLVLTIWTRILIVLVSMLIILLIAPYPRKSNKGVSFK